MSLSEDIRSRYGRDQQTVLEACDALVEELLPKQADETKPIDLEIAAKRLGITVSIDSSVPFEGRFRRRGESEPEITLKRSPRDARTRFTLAHEIGHFMIDEVVGSRSMELFRNPVGNEIANRDEEYFADVLAGAIVMPKRLIAMNGIPKLTFELLNRSMKRFGVSREAYLRRYASVFHKDIVYITCVPKVFKDHASMAIVDHGSRLTAKAGYARLRDRSAFAKITPFNRVQSLVAEGVEMFLGKKRRKVKGETCFELGMIPKVRILAEDLGKST